jgi:signal transduction histidine kinase
MNLVSTASRSTGSLSAAVSIVHDLRNPLAAIHGSAEMLAREGLSPIQIRRLARNVYSASIRMRELLEEFLDQSKDCDLDKQPTHVGSLVECAVEAIATSAEFQCVHVAQDVPRSLVVDLDRRRMQRVLVNLLANALEAMPDGGAIRIAAAANLDSVLMQVRDTGPGIAPEIRDRLFRPFVTAGKPRGTGLGLAIARQVVLDHGGEMWAESSPRGACFSLRLPAATQFRTIPSG